MLPLTEYHKLEKSTWLTIQEAGKSKNQGATAAEGFAVLYLAEGVTKPESSTHFYKKSTAGITLSPLITSWGSQLSTLVLGIMFPQCEMWWAHSIHRTYLGQAIHFCKLQ